MEIFGTKAETLERIKPRLQKSTVPDLLYFTVAQYGKAPQTLLRSIQTRYGSGRLVIRSSAFNEDGSAHSMAGAYTSCLGIPGSSVPQIQAGIAEVIGSYAGNPADQVLVQPMLEDVTVCGVIMTHDIESGAPYYVLNYDDETGTTDRVTGGVGVNKTVVVHHDYCPDHIDSPRIAEMLAMVHELEALFGGREALDIEFAKTRDGVLYLLQVRRITVQRNWNRSHQSQMSQAIRQVGDFIQERSAPRDGLAGETTVLGQMPDWNPAEIIGTSPRPLAVSLYRDLVTDRIWQAARAQMGYRAVPQETLMVMLAGRPYIDVRNSFNSFLPADLHPDVGEALVNAWLGRLADHPEFHDKVEFQVAQTIVDFDFDADFRRRYTGVLTATQFAHYRDRLTHLTGTSIDLTPTGSLAQALAQVSRLQNDPAPSIAPSPLLGVLRSLERCRTDGTQPFAVIARHAFIAETLLRSAVTRGALTPERFDSFKHSLLTVAGELTQDFGAVMAGHQDRSAFLARYGHLRPGTYDILSLRYDQRDDLFRVTQTGSVPPAPLPFVPTLHERMALEALLCEVGLDHLSANELLEYARIAIVNREHAKFVFTRSLSDALEWIATWGSRVGLTREDLSFLTLTEILDTAMAPPLLPVGEHFGQIAETRRKTADVTRHLRLGYIVRGLRDLYVVPLHRSAPNFVSDRSVQAPLVRLDGRMTGHVDLFNKIVCIENADPGFDWIFTRGIAGLISKFGGANSHMTIRCAELGLPAAIGVGEQTFERLVAGTQIELNCAEQIVRPASAGPVVEDGILHFLPVATLRHAA